MASWGYFFAGLLFSTVAAFGTIVIFLTFTPGFNLIMNSLSSFASSTPGLASVNGYITQGNTIYMGMFDFMMISLAIVCFWLAFVNEPDEAEMVSNVAF